MAARALKDVFIVAGKRTPIGSMGGSVSHMSPTDLGVVATKAAIAQANIDPNKIEDIYFGNVSQTAIDTPYLARHVGLRSGIAEETPALTVNRLCGAGFESVVLATKGILCGESKVSLAGGAETMSMAPYAVRDIRKGTKFPNNLVLEDTLWSALNDQHIKMPMALTAEKVGEKLGITREACDAYALRSQHNWQKCKDEGRFDQEIAPVELVTKKGTTIFSTDEHPRGGQATIESLNKLKSMFKKDGLVTAGNASGISDGAGSLILASEEGVKENNLKPITRVVAWASVGVDPSIMGYGPVPAIQKALKCAGLTMADMDIIEINEAFAAQYLACEKALDIDPTKTNLDGGAIAIGHPTGASGSRIMMHLSYELQRTGKRYGVGSACCGGGQGIAIIVERC
jgi:acetyl-CoA acyltransferase 2